MGTAFAIENTTELRAFVLGYLRSCEPLVPTMTLVMALAKVGPTITLGELSETLDLLVLEGYLAKEPGFTGFRVIRRPD